MSRTAEAPIRANERVRVRAELGVVNDHIHGCFRATD
jgi:hypothetical protein